MSKLSISKAWEDTTRIVGHDGKLITSVALAMIVLPQTVSGLIAPPPTLSGVNPPSWMPLVILAVGILSIAGEIAIIRLALGRTSVGEAIAHGRDGSFRLSRRSSWSCSRSQSSWSR